MGRHNLFFPSHETILVFIFLVCLCIAQCCTYCNRGSSPSLIWCSTSGLLVIKTVKNYLGFFFFFLLHRVLVVLRGSSLIVVHGLWSMWAL